MPFAYSHVKGGFTDTWHLQDWIEMVGGIHFVFKVMSKERICSFHSSALPCGVLPLVPNALYSQMTLLNPCGQWTFVGPPFLWRAEQEARVGAM